MSLTKPGQAKNIWDSYHGKIYSHNGGWRIGEGVKSHGYSMMEELVGGVSWFQVMMLNVLGRLPEKRLADWLEAIYICLSWPDPRIWCNQIGALGGSSRASVVASTVAGVLAADSTMYGTRPLLAGVRFIQAALQDKLLGKSAQLIVAEEVKKHRGKVNLMGYARPIASGDERVTAMERVSRELGFETGAHLKLAYEIDEVLQRDYQEGMNINGYVSAFLSDQGFTAEEIYRLCAMCITSGVTACYVDSSERPADAFLPMRCDDVEYTGKPPREIPLCDE